MFLFSYLYVRFIFIQTPAHPDKEGMLWSSSWVLGQWANNSSPVKNSSCSENSVTALDDRTGLQREKEDRREDGWMTLMLWGGGAGWLERSSPGSGGGLQTNCCVSQGHMMSAKENTKKKYVLYD